MSSLVSDFQQFDYIVFHSGSTYATHQQISSRSVD